MNQRRRIFEPSARDETSASVCLYCHVSLSDQRAALTRIRHNLFRHIGADSIAFEMRCSCGAYLVVTKLRDGGLRLVSGDQRDLVEHVRALNREDFADEREP